MVLIKDAIKDAEKTRMQVRNAREAAMKEVKSDGKAKHSPEAKKVGLPSGFCLALWN